MRVGERERDRQGGSKRERVIERERERERVSEKERAHFSTFMIFWRKTFFLIVSSFVASFGFN